MTVSDPLSAPRSSSRSLEGYALCSVLLWAEDVGTPGANLDSTAGSRDSPWDADLAQGLCLEATGGGSSSLASARREHDVKGSTKAAATKHHCAQLRIAAVEDVLGGSSQQKRLVHACDHFYRCVHCPMSHGLL